MRKVYLQTKSLEESKELYKSGLEGFFQEVKTEKIEVRQAHGRVTSQAVYSKVSSPLYHSSAMDGIMVKSEETQMARDHSPVLLKEGSFKFCDTGDPIVKPHDAVIMVEELNQVEEGFTIKKPVHPWENIRPMGEDIIEKDLLFPRYHRLEPIDLSVLLAAGVQEVDVVKKPKLAIIPTGDEIVSGRESLRIGDIIESNSAMFQAMGEKAQAEVSVLAIVEDDKEILKEAVTKAYEDFDLVCMIAGSSAGRDDYTVQIAEELGRVYVHGISIKPGKPAVLATIHGKPFVGLPGYPVSGHIVFQEFIQPILLKKGHQPEKEENFVQARLTKPVVSTLRHQEYVRVKLGQIEGKYSATPMDRGAGASMSLAESDAYLIVPQNSEGYNQGDQVQVRLHRPFYKGQMENRIVSIGSHDLVVDVLNDLFAGRGEKTSIVSSHVGSLSGLQSLLAKECHIAPSHLLGRDGVYNDEAVRMLFPEDEKMIGIMGVGRRQGIILPKGNPLKIQSLQDLQGKSMINRQRGAGTRVLFDYLLDQEGLSSEDFPGYDNEATTHLAVALGVKNGDADFGIGIESAALKLDCDFVYLADESYEFITYEEYLQKESIQSLIAMLESEEFRKTAESLGGYETKESGKVRTIAL